MLQNEWNKKFGLAEPACLLKWSWTSLFLQQQKASSCHRPIAEPVTIENFNDFHNTPGVMEARRKMLNGEWPGRGCEYCRDIEAVGGLSDRQQNNNNGVFLDERTPEELKADPTAVKVTPKMLEVNFSNLCNQACLYCFPKCSTKIETEFRREFAERRRKEQGQDAYELLKRTWKREDEERDNRYQEMKFLFWNWMKEHASSLVNYRILGGEPFYQPELWENIEFFQNNPCPRTAITVFTNFNVEIKRFKKALDAWKQLVVDKHILELNIVISTDSFGPAEEYVRFGSNMKKWDANWELLQEYYEYFNVSILSTLCNLNIKEAIHIVRKFNSSKYAGRRFSAMHFNIADGHPPIHFTIFPKGFFDEEFDLIASEMIEPHFKKQIEGYKIVANSKPYDPGMVKKLKRHLDRMDGLRGTNWKQTFPWLVEFDPDAYPRED